MIESVICHLQRFSTSFYIYIYTIYIYWGLFPHLSTIWDISFSRDSRPCTSEVNLDIIRLLCEYIYTGTESTVRAGDGPPWPPCPMENLKIVDVKRCKTKIWVPCNIYLEHSLVNRKTMLGIYFMVYIILYIYIYNNGYISLCWTVCSFLFAERNLLISHRFRSTWGNWDLVVACMIFDHSIFLSIRRATLVVFFPYFRRTFFHLKFLYKHEYKLIYTYRYIYIYL